MKETKTAWILAKIKTRGFVEAKNVNQLAKSLGVKAENLRPIIASIAIGKKNKEHNYQDFFFVKIPIATICYKWADESKSVLSDKMNEILGVK
jgi:hypothetical protein